MRWPVFALAGFLLLALDAGLRHVLRFGDAMPSLLPILVVFVAFFAPRSSALWAAWAAGLATDLLLADFAHGPDQAGPILGPNALGYVFGAFVIVVVRPMLLRRRAVTLAVATVVFGVAAALTAIFIVALHGWYDPLPPRWADAGPLAETWRRFREAAMTGVLALLVGPILAWTWPAWGFRSPLPRAR